MIDYEEFRLHLIQVLDSVSPRPTLVVKRSAFIDYDQE